MDVRGSDVRGPFSDVRGPFLNVRGSFEAFFGFWTFGVGTFGVLAVRVFGGSEFLEVQGSYVQGPFLDVWGSSYPFFLDVRGFGRSGFWTFRVFGRWGVQPRTSDFQNPECPSN